MNRRDALLVIGSGGAVGGGLLVGGALYGSSDLDFEPANSGSVVRKNGERFDSFNNAITPVEDDDAILGISVPDRATVQRVAVEVVWAIQRDGLWSDVTLNSKQRVTLGQRLIPAMQPPPIRRGGDQRQQLMAQPLHSDGMRTHVGRPQAAPTPLSQFIRVRIRKSHSSHSMRDCRHVRSVALALS